MKVSAILLVLIAVGAIGCHGSRYSGDGTFSDSGIGASSNRYVVALGPVILNTDHDVEYHLVGLPAETFTIGLAVTAKTPIAQPIYEARPISSIVHVLLLEEHGREVINEVRPLSDWVWAGEAGTPDRSFVWIRGESAEQPLNNGWTSEVPVGLKADGGWGTSFNARRDGRYTVRIGVRAANPSSGEFDAFLQASGGGWK